MKNIFDRKLVFITGGSSGIGQALAKDLTRRGANVYIVSRKLENLTETIVQLKAKKVHPDQQIGLISADVSNDKHFGQMMCALCERVGTPDYLINSAGIVFPGSVLDLDLKVFRDIMDVNFFGVVSATKAILPKMIERGSGHIVNISSFVGFFASYGYSAYGSSKFAVRGFSDVLRAEVKPYGIKVSVVFPADTDTPQLAFERAHQPPIMREINATTGEMSAEKTAEGILNGISKNTYAITPGFEPTLAYWITNIAGYLQRPLIDSTIASARKKMEANASKKSKKT
jgi:3-dehydrosphinganine reductase